MVSKRRGRSHHKPTLFSGLNPLWGLLDGGTGSKAFWECQPSVTHKTQNVPTNPQHQHISPQKSKGRNTSSVNSRKYSQFQCPAGRIYWNTELFCSRSKPIPLCGVKCPTCAAELQLAHEHDVMLLPAPTDLSQLHGEGNDTTTRPGKGIRESFLLRHGGWTRRMEVQAGCICSPCHNVKREQSPSWCPGNSPESCKVGYRKLQVFF